MQVSPSTTVQLIPVFKAGQFDKWQMSQNGQPPVEPKASVLPVPKGVSPYVISFSIKNQPANQIVFAPTVGAPPPGTGPIYIQAGTAKPTSGVDAQFSFTVSTDGKTLSLTDTNSTAGNYQYVMNFTGAGQLDPILNNGGPGFVGGGGSTYSTIWYGVGIVAIIAVVVVALRFARKRT